MSSNEPVYEEMVWERIVREEDRPCGCPDDYHLSDCPIRTAGFETTNDEWDPYGDEY